MSAGPIRTRADLARYRAADAAMNGVDRWRPVHALTRGVVHFRLARYELAAKEFDEHLEASPDGPLTLRAHNYLRAAIGRAKAEPF